MTPEQVEPCFIWRKAQGISLVSSSEFEPPIVAEMAYHLPPSAAGNASSSDSSTSSNPQYTPVSKGSEDDEYPASGSRPKQSPVGPLRLQTDFGGTEGAVGGPISDIEDGDGFDTRTELKGKRTRGPKYTLEEEKEVIRIFDKRLVPFLALLYLLAFLDRSSMFFNTRG